MKKLMTVRSRAFHNGRYRVLMLVSLLLPVLLPAKSREEFLEEDVEYSKPQVLAEYWPVFYGDPYDEERGSPIIDLVLNREGGVVLFDVLSDYPDQVENTLKLTAASGVFRPAVVAGEETISFLRYPLQSYFYIENEVIGNLSKAPQSLFLVSKDTLEGFHMLAAEEQQWQLRFRLLIDKNGRIDSVDSFDPYEEYLEKLLFEQLEKSAKFSPAEVNGRPVEVEVVMVLIIDPLRFSSKLMEIADNFRINSKPMPSRPASRVIDNKPYSVDLEFFESGAVKSIILSSPMSDTVAMEAMKAFRRWRLPRSELRDLDLTSNVVFSYKESEEQAALIGQNPTTHFSEAVPIERKPAVFPNSLSLRFAKRDGYAVIDYAIDKNGKVQHAHPLFATHPDFAEAARWAVSDWSFQPATAGGKPVITRVRSVIPFSLRD